MTPKPLKLKDSSKTPNSTAIPGENKNPIIDSDQKKKRANDIRSFFTPCTAADYFSKFEKPDYENMKKQTAIVKKQRESKKCSDDILQSEVDIEMKEEETSNNNNSNKPLKRRKKTPSPKKPPNSLKVDPPNPDLSKLSLQKQSIDANGEPEQKESKQRVKKRKLSQISNEGKSKEVANPPAKKRKFYPGFKRQDVPPLHGQTEIPIGKALCFQNMRFVITGQLPSLTRDECKDLIQEYGGRYAHSDMHVRIDNIFLSHTE